MDDFGQYLEEPDDLTEQTVTVFVSSTFEEFGQLRRLLDGLPSTLEYPMIVHNLDDGHARGHASLQQSLVRASQSDVLLLLLGRKAGNLVPNSNRTYIQTEYDTAIANNRDVLVYEQVVADDDIEPRLAEFKDELRLHHSIGTLDNLADIFQYESIAERLQKWLVENRRPGRRTTGLVALGHELDVAVDRGWRDHTINHLDRWVMGNPTPRTESGNSSLAEQANDQWNEACVAFRLRAGEVMASHLERVIELRPLDGQARYWLARLLMVNGDWSAALRHLEVATRIHEDVAGSQAGTGLSYLVQAKCLRRLQKLERARIAVQEALIRLPWHSESHLEACYLELASGDIGLAEDHLADAFYCYPPSFDFADNQLAELAGGPDVQTRVRRRLLGEIRDQLTGMYQFEIDVGRALVQAQRRNAVSGEELNTFAEASDDPTDVEVIGLAQRRNRGTTNDDDVKPLGNSHGIVQVAADSDDPVRLAGLGRSLSTLNHTRVVNLQEQTEVTARHHARSQRHHDRLAEQTESVRRTVLMVAAYSLAIIAFLALIGQIALSSAILAALLVASAAGFGLWWFNRESLEQAGTSVARTGQHLARAVDEFEQLVGRFEEAHTATRFYLPLTGRVYGRRRFWRLRPGSSVFSMVSNDAVPPHIRSVIGGEPVVGRSDLRLYRAAPGLARSALAERWRAYASNAALAAEGEAVDDGSAVVGAGLVNSGGAGDDDGDGDDSKGGAKA